MTIATGSLRFAAALPLVLAVTLGIACEPSPTIVLATIESVSPEVVEPGEIIEIRGSGFVEGPASVELQGQFDPFGLIDPTERTVNLEGTAISESTIQIKVSGTTMESLAKEPLVFNGAVTVSFPAALQGSSTRIGATSDPLSLELRPAGGGVAVEADRAREADRILELLGVTLRRSAEGEELVIARVAANSEADRAGMGTGDRLMAVDGVALAAPTDIAGMDPTGEHQFEIVTQSGTIQSINLRLIPVDPLEMDEFAAVVLTSIALGIFLVFAWPAFSRRRGAQNTPANPLALALGMAMVSLPIVAFPALAVLTRADMGAGLVLLGITVASLVVTTLYGKSRLRALSLLARVLPVPVLLIIAGALGSTFGVWNVISSQAQGPWGWHVWSNPFALVTVVLAMTLLWPRFDELDNAAPIARLAAWSAAISSSIVITAYALGGWLLPSLSATYPENSTISLLAGIAVFAAKTWVVLLTARWFAGVGLKDRRSHRRMAINLMVRICLLLVCAVCALAWNWAQLPEDLMAAGRVLSGGVSLALATAFVTSRIRSVLAAHQRLEGPLGSTNS